MLTAGGARRVGRRALQNDEDRRFRKHRVNEIQSAMNEAETFLRKIRATSKRFGVTPLVADL